MKLVSGNPAEIALICSPSELGWPDCYIKLVVQGKEYGTDEIGDDIYAFIYRMREATRAKPEPFPEAFKADWRAILQLLTEECSVDETQHDALFEEIAENPERVIFYDSEVVFDNLMILMISDGSQVKIAVSETPGTKASCVAVREGRFERLLEDLEISANAVEVK